MHTSNTLHVETIMSNSFDVYEIEINQDQILIRNVDINEYISILVDEWRDFSQEVIELFEKDLERTTPETKILDSCSHESIMYYMLDDSAFALISETRLEIDIVSFRDACNIVRNYM